MSKILEVYPYLRLDGAAKAINFFHQIFTLMNSRGRSVAISLAIVFGVAACPRTVAQTDVNAKDAIAELVTVCDLARDPKAYDRKSVIVLGRISKRGTARLVGEDACDDSAKGTSAILDIRFDASAPLPPRNFGLDAAEVKRRFVEVGRRTAIHDFPFGSGSYDHWGLVFGRFELRPSPGDAKVPENGAVVCHGDALIFLWSAR